MLVSFCITTFNRSGKLRSCLESFQKTNCFDGDVELILVDNGSTDDETRDFLSSFDATLYGFSSSKILRRDTNDYPFGQKLSRVAAREAASGDFHIDCPDDHLFVVEHDWITYGIEYIKRYDSSDFETKVGCLVHYAQPAYRFSKQNNAFVASQLDDRCIISEHKGYADYNLMSAKTYDKIGEFLPNLGRSCERNY